MAVPVEFRYLLRLATIEDIANGVQPIRQQTGAGVQLFCPPVLQFRYREKGEDGGLRWSAYRDVMYEREGDPPPH